MVRGKGNTCPDNMVTIDHIHGKLDPNRKFDPRGKGKNPSSVLSCLKCNNDRGRADELGLGIEELRRRSHRHPEKPDE